MTVRLTSMGSSSAPDPAPSASTRNAVRAPRAELNLDLHRFEPADKFEPVAIESL